MLVRRLGVAYGSVGLFTAILHNVFLLYHVDTFVSIYKIDKYSFWLAEAIFLVWNSVNDPIFGWISDKQYLLHGEGGVDVVLKRVRALRFNGPLFCLSFIAFWVLWTYPVLQLVLCLCVYDGFLTVIDLHHSALIADLAVSADTRADLNAYCSVFSCVGSLSVFLSYAAWDREDLTSFRIFCVALCVISLVGFMLSTRTLISLYTSKQEKNGGKQELQVAGPSSKTVSLSDLAKEKAALKVFLKQLTGHSNFMFFSIMNLVQVFHCHFNSNFFPLFLESLLGESISPTMASVLLGISFVAPHINNLYFLRLCRRHSVYTVIKWLFVIKLVLTLLMYGLGPDHTVMLCLFIASNRVFTEGTCKLLNLVISDLVDEDYVIHSRHQAVSALLFGMAAFISKPGQTLAPLIGYWLLSVQTGHDIFESGNTLGSVKLNAAGLDPAEVEAYRSGVFTLLISVPIFCAIIQLLIWSQYTLRDKRLQWVKAVRAGAQYATV